MSKKKQTDEEKATALKNLKRALKPGQTIYFVVTHVSKSGMQRSIEFYIPCFDKVWDTSRNKGFGGYTRRLAISRITWEMSRVLGYRIDQKNGGIIVGGCGMDMGFHCVYTLGSRLWPKGTSKPHSTRNGEADSTGGYALKSRQM
jgi:hypothetical protein